MTGRIDCGGKGDVILFLSRFPPTFCALDLKEFAEVNRTLRRETRRNGASPIFPRDLSIHPSSLRAISFFLSKKPVSLLLSSPLPSTSLFGTIPERALGGLDSAWCIRSNNAMKCVHILDSPVAWTYYFAARNTA